MLKSDFNMLNDVHSQTLQLHVFVTLYSLQGGSGNQEASPLKDFWKLSGWKQLSICEASYLDDGSPSLLHSADELLI